MKKKNIVIISLILLSVALIYIYLVTSPRFFMLRRQSQVAIEVNGISVDGDFVAGTRNAVVTRRDVGKQHSYHLFFEADTDAAGDNGFVVDCMDWVAPRFRILLETPSYPPCSIASKDGSPYRRRLVRSGQFLQFETPYQEKFKIQLK